MPYRPLLPPIIPLFPPFSGAYKLGYALPCVRRADNRPGRIVARVREAAVYSSATVLVLVRGRGCARLPLDVSKLSFWQLFASRVRVREALGWGNDS